MVTYPPENQVDLDIKRLRKLLRDHGVPPKTLQSIQTKAFRTGRKITGEWATNRESRWSIVPEHPQYGSKLDCKIILVKLFAQIFCFDNAPALESNERDYLKNNYLGHRVTPNVYRDRLLLERFDFNDLVSEGLEPVHGHSSFHIGHEDPTVQPKHKPGNIGWRTFRSNLIQGNMTLRQARIYFLKLIGRYFELGELDIS